VLVAAGLIYWHIPLMQFIKGQKQIKYNATLALYVLLACSVTVRNLKDSLCIEFSGIIYLNKVYSLNAPQGH
jgi:hypothetical protein